MTGVVKPETGETRASREFSGNVISVVPDVFSAHFIEKKKSAVSSFCALGGRMPLDIRKFVLRFFPVLIWFPQPICNPCRESGVAMNALQIPQGLRDKHALIRL
jgi:hypothetical protein